MVYAILFCILIIVVSIQVFFIGKLLSNQKIIINEILNYRKMFEAVANDLKAMSDHINHLTNEHNKVVNSFNQIKQEVDTELTFKELSKYKNINKA